MGPPASQKLRIYGRALSDLLELYVRSLRKEGRYQWGGHRGHTLIGRKPFISPDVLHDLVKQTGVIPRRVFHGTPPWYELGILVKGLQPQGARKFHKWGELRHGLFFTPDPRVALDMAERLLRRSNRWFPGVSPSILTAPVKTILQGQDAYWQFRFIDRLQRALSQMVRRPSQRSRRGTNPLKVPEVKNPLLGAEKIDIYNNLPFEIVTPNSIPPEYIRVHRYGG